jgi:hypothetical protein
MADENVGFRCFRTRSNAVGDGLQHYQCLLGLYVGSVGVVTSFFVRFRVRIGA